MKIKITESQYNTIKLIKEDTDELAKFKKLCDDKVAELDKIYSKITFESVSDLLSMNLNMKELNRLVSRIEDVVYRAEKYLSNVYQGKEDVELWLSDTADVVNDKATSLTLILNKLEELQDYEEEHNLTSRFSNVKPREI